MFSFSLSITLSTNLVTIKLQMLHIKNFIYTKITVN